MVFVRFLSNSENAQIHYYVSILDDLEAHVTLQQCEDFKDDDNEEVSPDT